MTTPYSGGCACGAIRYHIDAEPLMAAHCQCRQCQRDSGTGHASHLAFAAAACRLEGEPRFYDQQADSGNTVSRGFCATCGSPVCSKNSSMPDLFFVRAGSLDDPSLFSPQVIVWTKAAQPWDQLPEEVPSFETMPPPQGVPPHA